MSRERVPFPQLLGFGPIRGKLVDARVSGISCPSYPFERLNAFIRARAELVEIAH